MNASVAQSVERWSHKQTVIHIGTNHWTTEKSVGDAHTRGEYLDATHVPDECPVSVTPRTTVWHDPLQVLPEISRGLGFNPQRRHFFVGFYFWSETIPPYVHNVT